MTCKANFSLPRCSLTSLLMSCCTRQMFAAKYCFKAHVHSTCQQQSGLAQSATNLDSSAGCPLKPLAMQQEWLLEPQWPKAHHHDHWQPSMMAIKVFSKI